MEFRRLVHGYAWTIGYAIIVGLLFAIMLAVGAR